MGIASVSRMEIEEGPQHIIVIGMSAGGPNEKDKKDFERKISLYIKEIDKCIAFLGQ